MKRNHDFFIKLASAEKKNLIEIENDVGKYFLSRFKEFDNIIPTNIGGETTRVDKYIKNLLKETEEDIIIDPNGSQKPPDFIFRGKKGELKSSKYGSFCFNDSPIDIETLYIFMDRSYEPKIFIVCGCNLPKFPEEYIKDITQLKEKWYSYFSADAFFITYARPNIYVKPKFMDVLPDFSYYDGEHLWI